MSTTLVPSANPFAALANQLVQVSSLSEEQQIFKDALEKVVQERKQKQGKGQKLPEIFDKLCHVQTIEDVNLAVKAEKDRNVFWTRDIGSVWIQNISKWAEQALLYKVILDGVASRSQSVGAPIWGTFAFLLAVLKDLNVARQDLEHIEYRLAQSQDRFKRYYGTGQPLPSDLKRALHRYYEVVLNFTIDMHTEFSHSRAMALAMTVHRSVKSKLDDLSKVIQDIIYDVDQGGSNNWQDSMTQKVNHFSNSLQLAVGVSYGLPQQNPKFKGRLKYLKQIYEAFHRPSSHENRMVVYGMGGIGKTQILQKYAHDSLVLRGSSRTHNVVIYIRAHNQASVLTAVTSFMRTHAPEEFIADPPSLTNYHSFHEWLLRHKNWLIVLDNIQDYQHVSLMLPNGQPGNILCSTRHRLIASQIAGSGGMVELLGMEQPDSIELILSIAENSKHACDKTRDIAIEVASFAKGIPLLMEQLVHNAILSGSTLAVTLAAVQKNSELLAQKNISSLHEDNLSLGGIVVQALQTIRNRSEPAAALLMLLAYLDTSNIPFWVIYRGSRRFQSYIQRDQTYDRGDVVIDRCSRTGHDRIHAPSSGAISYWAEVNLKNPMSYWRTMKHKTASKAEAQRKLPVDDIQMVTMLNDRFGPGTPMARLFQDNDTIDLAFEILQNIAIIRKTSDSYVWMHDLISEVLQVLICENLKIPENDMALLAATMVYLAIPVPGIFKFGSWRRVLCKRFLPQATHVHNHLKRLGILNDSSVGPELSHIIGSIIQWIGITDTGSGKPLGQQFEEERVAIRKYFTDAYEGYMAGWNRLQTQHCITDDQIMSATALDRDRQKTMVQGAGEFAYWELDNRANGERYGRSAPWRAMQTACQLSDLPLNIIGSMELKIYYTRIALDFYAKAFGTNDKDTMTIKLNLINYLGQDSKRWDKAYLQNKQFFEDLCGDAAQCEMVLYGADTTLRLDVMYCYGFSGLADRMITCCLELAEQRAASDPCCTRARADEAIVYCQLLMTCTEIREPRRRNFQAKYAYLLARAHELAGRLHEAIQWYCRSACWILGTDIYRKDLMPYGSINYVLERCRKSVAAVDRLVPSVGLENLPPATQKLGEEARESLKYAAVLGAEERERQEKGNEKRMHEFEERGYTLEHFPELDDYL